MKIFNLPDLGEGLAEAEIREWYVKEGDEVKTEQPLVAVETAKALVDVPSPHSGKIVKLYGKPGDIIKTGKPLVEFADTTATDDSGTIVGKVEVGHKVLKESATGIENKTISSARFKAMPAVRALAKALNVDLEQVTPTGPQGSITLEDVKNASGKISQPSTPSHVFNEPLHGARRAMASNIAMAHREIVPVTLMDFADIHHWSTDEDFTLRIIRAITLACHAEPALNAHFDGKSLTRQLYKDINLGLAVDTVDGLYVPVIKNVNHCNKTELREIINQFKAYAKKQAFPLEALQGATITLSNFGTIAGRYANPMIVPPTVAIIGTGKSSDEVVPIGGKAVIHRILPLSLTFDHRAVTGGEAARFLAALIDDLQNNAHKN